jgi:hypothetical protein
MSGSSSSKTGIPSTSTIASPPTAVEDLLKRMAGITSKTLTDNERSELFTCAIKSFIAFALLLTSATTIFIASYNRETYSKNYFKYMIFIILPLVVSSYLILPIFSQKLSTPVILLNGCIFIVFLVSIYGFYNIKTPESVVLAQYSIYAIVFLSTIVGLAIIYKFFVRYIYNNRTWESAILQIIFFIPCLLIDFIEFMKKEFKITSKTTYLLLILEVLILVFYFVIIPKLFSIKPKDTTKILLSSAVFLNKETIIGDKTIFSIKINDEVKTIQNFSISFWTFINNNTTSTTLLRIGDQAKPMGNLNIISNSDGTYICRIPGLKDIVLNKNDDSPEDIRINKDIKRTLPIQKWNHIAVSIDNNKVNVFLNGQLNNVHSIEKKDYVFEFGDNAIITGSNNSTTNLGAICNVRYYTIPITLDEVVSEYDMLKYKNPPIQNMGDTINRFKI